MITQQIHRACQTHVTRTLATLAAFTLISFFANHTLAARHTVVNLDETFVDTDSFCVPVQAHSQGMLILGSDFPRLTVVQLVTIEWTNIETGKTVTTRTVGRAITRFENETVVIITGAVMIQHRGGPWVDAGLVEFVVEFDPDTGEEMNLVVRAAGNHPGSFGDALCAALQ